MTSSSSSSNETTLPSLTLTAQYTTRSTDLERVIQRYADGHVVTKLYQLDSQGKRCRLGSLRISHISPTHAGHGNQQCRVFADHIEAIVGQEEQF